MNSIKSPAGRSLVTISAPEGNPSPKTLTIYIEGPPGSGKTNLALLLQHISQGVPLNGEHLLKVSQQLAKACIYDAGRTVQRFTPAPGMDVNFHPGTLSASSQGGTGKAPEWESERVAKLVEEERKAIDLLYPKEPGPLLQLVFMDGAQPWDSSIDTIDQDRLSGETIAVLHKAGVLAVGPFNINFITVPRRLGPEFAQEIRDAVLGDSTLRLHYLLTGAGLIPPWDGPKPEA